jgi:hypothetical protein
MKIGRLGETPAISVQLNGGCRRGLLLSTDFVLAYCIVWMSTGSPCIHPACKPRLTASRGPVLSDLRGFFQVYCCCPVHKYKAVTVPSPELIQSSWAGSGRKKLKAYCGMPQPHPAQKVADSHYIHGCPGWVPKMACAEGLSRTDLSPSLFSHAARLSELLSGYNTAQE